MPKKARGRSSERAPVDTEPKEAPKKRSKRTIEELERADTFAVVQETKRSPKKESPAPSPQKKKKIKKEQPQAASSASAMHSCKFVGAHLSVQGGPHNAILDAIKLKANAVALFTRNQRTWKASRMSPETAKLFRDTVKETGFNPRMILPHGSYLINLASPDEEGLRKSKEGFLDELQRCEQLGIPNYNFHPGSTRGELSAEEGLKQIAEAINWAHGKTKDVVVVLENTAGAGFTIGRNFEELKGIIDLVVDKTRIGVCLDTCHLFASGYDVKSEAGFAKTMTEFEATVGLKFLRGVHLNDSKSELGSQKDRHENIGKGCIGLDCFRRIMRDRRFDNVPLILETPASSESVYEKEIALLRGFERS